MRSHPRFLRVAAGVQRFKGRLSGIDMTQGKPWKNLLLFTVPLLVGNLFQQLYSTADAVILGRFVGDYALAAVGSSMPIFFLLMVLMMGIAIGAGIMVSQYFGAKRREDLSHTIGVSITITTVLGAAMMLLGPLGTRPLLILLNTPPEILDDSVLYMNILLWGVLGMAYFNILSGILRGLGDAFSPLLYLALTSVLNVLLNLLFIPVLGWGVWGAAIGTVLAQGLTSLLCLRRLLKMRDVFDMGFRYIRPRKQYVAQVLKLGVPTGASQAIFALGFMVVQPLANDFGPLFLAVNIIVMRIDGFVMMPNFSFGNAITVFAGQNMGAGKLDRVGQGTRQCAFMAMGTAIVLVGVILLFGGHIAGAFTETQEVIDMSVRMLRILAVGYVIFALNSVMWGVIRGAGDALTPMWASIINVVLVRVPTAYLFVHLMGRPEALFYSLLAGWVMITLLGLAAYRIGRWRKMGLVKSQIEVRTAALGELEDYRYTVIFSRYRDKWLYCRAKERDSYETAGGHIEPDETPLEGAKRELKEETGALQFEITPAFDYSTHRPGQAPSAGQVFFAEIHELGDMPGFEMAEVALFDGTPDKMRFPMILPVLFEHLQRWISPPPP